MFKTETSTRRLQVPVAGRPGHHIMGRSRDIYGASVKRVF